MIRFLIFLLNDRPKIFIRVWRVLVDRNMSVEFYRTLSIFSDFFILVQSFTMKIHNMHGSDIRVEFKSSSLCCSYSPLKVVISTGHHYDLVNNRVVTFVNL